MGSVRESAHPGLTVEALARATKRFADLIDTADLDASVPSCPPWTVADLVRHLGQVHAWAASSVRIRDRPPATSVRDVPRDALGPWYREIAHDLTELLSGTDPAAVVWVFGPAEGDGTAYFWVRRQVHETLIHTWDMLAARHIDEDVDAVIAWDGVEEVRDVFYPRQVALHRADPLPAALHLRPADLDRPPVIIGTGEPIRVDLPASDLLLALWHRRRPAGISHRAEELIARALTP